MPGAWRRAMAGKRGGRNVNMPDEYICDLCGYVFLFGEVPSLFCPNCGSSMVAKEVMYDEFFDDEPVITILNL